MVSDSPVASPQQCSWIFLAFVDNFVAGLAAGLMVLLYETLAAAVHLGHVADGSRGLQAGTREAKTRF
jgi:hypothetical protein